MLAKARSQGTGLWVTTILVLSAWGTVKINIGNGQTWGNFLTHWSQSGSCPRLPIALQGEGADDYRVYFCPLQYFRGMGGSAAQVRSWFWSQGSSHCLGSTCLESTSLCDLRLKLSKQLRGPVSSFAKWDDDDDDMTPSLMDKQTVA